MTRKVRVQSVSLKGMCDIDADPTVDIDAESKLLGGMQAEYLLSLVTPKQQEVARSACEKCRLRCGKPLPRS